MISQMFVFTTFKNISNVNFIIWVSVAKKKKIAGKTFIDMLFTSATSFVVFFFLPYAELIYLLHGIQYHFVALC